MPGKRGNEIPPRPHGLIFIASINQILEMGTFIT